MSELEPIPLTQTIKKVDYMIETGNGDTGRLYHILEFLKNSKPLYSSDQIYLENKLNSSFTVDEEVIKENDSLVKIKELIDSGKGDPGRLQHIYDMVENDKPLYHSDIVYLESKLSPDVSIISKLEPPIMIREFSSPSKNSNFVKPESKTQGSMPKGWDSSGNEELTNLSDTITLEEETISKQKRISDEIDSNREKLSRLILHRKEYEQKVIKGKSSLELQIQDERLRIETQTRISKEIISQKEELSKVKNERVNVIKKIDSEKSKISKELSEQKRLLTQSQLEQEKIEKQIQNEQNLLTKMTGEQKLRLASQAKAASEIKLKQIDLENTKHDYDEIVSQIHEEKSKFTELAKLKKSIQIQEQELISAKEDRLELINDISKEKESILQKTQDENKKIQSQAEMIKQLKKEEKLFESLQKKHDKIEKQIKSKNQKMKEKQQKLKKQIADKDKKLKLLEKKQPGQKHSKTKK